MKLFVPLPRVSRAPRSLASGSSDSLGRGMDIALTLGVFLVLGWLLDGWLATTPWFTVGLTVVAAVGQFIRMKYVYDAEMERLEAERRSARTASTDRSATAVRDAV